MSNIKNLTRNFKKNIHFMLLFFESFTPFFNILYIKNITFLTFPRFYIRYVFTLVIFLYFRFLVYIDFDWQQLEYIRFFFGPIFLIPLFYKQKINLTFIFYAICSMIFLETILINTIIDPHTMPNFPSEEAYSHFVEAGNYQRPYSFGANRSPVNPCSVILRTPVPLRR